MSRLNGKSQPGSFNLNYPVLSVRTSTCREDRNLMLWPISNLVSRHLPQSLNGWKYRETPWKVRFVLCLLGGKILAITICASRQPNHVKHLSSGLKSLRKGIFYLLVSSPGDPRGVRCSYFLVRVSLHDFWFLSVDRNQRQGPTEA
jgi:hypothetical protein